MRLLFIILFFLNNQSLDSIFDSSNDLYTNGNYQMAVEGYQSILNSGFESAELYYNLGNAFYKLNNIPESNFFYEKAKSILDEASKIEVKNESDKILINQINQL